MVAKFIVSLALALYMAAAVPTSVRSGEKCDPTLFVFAAAAIKTDLDLFAKAAVEVSAKAKAAAATAAAAEADAKTLATLKVTKEGCVYGDAKAVAEASAIAVGQAFSYSKATAAAFGLAAAKVYAAGSALALAFAGCECASSKEISVEVLAFVDKSAELVKAAVAWTGSVEARAVAISASFELQISVSSAYASFCKECGHGFSKITLFSNDKDAKKAVDGNVNCAGLSAQAKALIPECR